MFGKRPVAGGLTYQAERPNVAAGDLTGLVIRALGMLVGKIVRIRRSSLA